MATDKLVDFDHVTDYISREDAVQCAVDIEADLFNDGSYGASAGASTVGIWLKNLPAADVRPVVLCRDCRWWTKQEKSLQGRCELAGFYPTGEWFCANGERSNCGAEMNPNLDTTKGERRDESSG